MAFYMDEEQVWKCPKHPSRRRRSGICAKCLRERLVTLCPDCASDGPCDCCPAPVDSSSSSSTSSVSFSLFSFSRGGSRRGFGTSNVEASRLSNNLEVDPTLRKSRSVAISFLRSRSKHVGTGGGGCDTELVAENNKTSLPKVSRSKINFWSVFTVNKSKKCDVHVDGTDEDANKSDDLTAVHANSTMTRSRSVAVGTGNGFTPASLKQKGWYLPSPVKAFRHSKPPRSVAVA
ncbi:hypothetical protein L1987_81337 [Smallanthus sonchifolius]|uniref:Uncharacterized protein n=1 Tax=Smallanthus sonchifolius TaxID=185202 RepID=A0ACB8YPH3_9ASTR|nr:hypothetical protein L1987_81337 [Smallanthus sonchifolius]